MGEALILRFLEKIQGRSGVFSGAFLFYAQVMKKLFSILCLFMVLPSVAWAQDCKDGELKLESVDAQTARLSGALQTPTPDYIYSFSVKEGESGYMHAELTITDENPGTPAAMVIGTLPVDETFAMPAAARTLMINVSSMFNWGPEYFQAKFPDGLAQHKSICMTPEMYK